MVAILIHNTINSLHYAIKSRGADSKAAMTHISPQTLGTKPTHQYLPAQRKKTYPVHVLKQNLFVVIKNIFPYSLRLIELLLNLTMLKY